MFPEFTDGGRRRRESTEGLKCSVLKHICKHPLLDKLNTSRGLKR